MKTDSKNKKEKSVSLRCTAEEKARLNKLAENNNLSLSNFMVKTCLYSNGLINSTEVLPEIFTLINEHQRKRITEKEFIDNIIRKVEELCQQ